MYCVVVVLLSAGDQVPVMPLVDVVGSGDKAAPAQIGATALNVGMVLAGLTVMVSVVPMAHCPAFGVKVYWVVAVLLSAGDQLPVMPLVEVVGNGDNVPPAQIGATGLKVAVVGLFTVMLKVVPCAHCPTFGVKV